MREQRLTDPFVEAPAARQEEMDIRRYAAVLARRWPLILSVFTAVMALVVLITIFQKRVYLAECKLVVSSKGQMGGASTVLSDFGFPTESNAATTVEIIDSPDLIQRAYNRMTAKDQLKGFNSPTVVPWSYEIRTLKDTNVVIIGARAYTPELAATFANAIADVYIKEDLDRNKKSIGNARAYVEKSLKQTRTELADALGEMARYQEQAGVLAPHVQAGEIETARVKMASDLAYARAEKVAAGGRLRVVEEELKRAAPEVPYQTTLAQNPEYISVQAQVVQLEGELAKVSQTFAPLAPERMDVQRQLEAAKARLKATVQMSVANSSKQRNPILPDLVTRYADAKAAAIGTSAHYRALTQQASELGAQVKSYPEKLRRFQILDQKADALKQTADLLSQQFYQLVIQEESQMPDAVVASDAQPPIDPASPKVVLNLVVGFILAVASAMFVGVMADHLDNKIRRTEDVEAVTGVPTLAMVPEATSKKERLYLGEAEPSHAFMEAFRMLRNNISFMAPARNLKTVAITSASMSEGKSTTSANLAIALAMDGKRVLLVDADLRRPTVHQWMGVSNEVGFTTVVRGMAKLEEAVRKTSWEGLYCLPAGPLPPDPTEFLNSAHSRETIFQTREKFDIVVLDAPPTVGLSDMQVICTIADGIVVVLGLGQTTKPMAFETVRLLRQAGGAILGLAVNHVRRNSHEYYGYSSYDGDSSAQNGSMKKRKKKASVQ